MTMFRNLRVPLSRLCLAICAAVVAALFASSPAAALPSFARQTGNACTACHVGGFGPRLTNYGRLFKLNGYVWGAEEQNLPPVAGMVVGSFTNTKKDQAGGAATHYGDNNNATLDEASVFYAGRILPKLGAFIQATYDGIERSFALDNVDIRYADQATLAGKNVVYGVSLNNNPTVQDPWNTTPAWGYPFSSSGLAPTPGTSTLIDGGLEMQVAGLTAYALWNDLLYLEGGVYGTQPRHAQSTLGIDPNGESQIHGAAPYWRAAVQHSVGEQYVAAGVFGLDAHIYPERDKTAGTDHVTDVGVDANYQVNLNEQSTITANAVFIRESQKLGASQSLGLAANSSNTFQTFKANAGYYYNNTYGLTGGYFTSWGSKDTGLFSADPIGGSRTQKPNSTGYLVEATYTPFGKDDSWLAPLANLRLGLQYVGYTKFNGAKLDYDGSGRNASDNNTMFLFAWLAF